VDYSDRNYWLDTVVMPAGTDGAVPARVDVAVIGAGYTGLSAARALALRGARVAVMEAHTIGWGASSRNGGMVLAGLKLGVQTLAARYGMAAAKRMYAASLASIDQTEQIIRAERIECDFGRCGHLEVASKASHFDAYARAADLMAGEFGHPLRVVPRQELRAEIGSDAYFGGIVDEASASLNPARYVAGLGRAALAAGATIHAHTRVGRIDRASGGGGEGKGGGFHLPTTRGPLFAREVVVATSGYTGSATPLLRRRIIPIGSFIIATERLPDAVARTVSPRNRMMFDSKHFLHYFRLTSDDRMLFGGRAAFFPETARTVRHSAAILRRDMVTVFPRLRDVKVEYAWGGTLDFCFDTMPHVGRLDGIHYAVGYAGHGVAMATYLGAEVAAVIGGAPPETPFGDIPFPVAPLGLYTGRPWFLPFAGAYYKVRDWVS
jgi:glycine/D-amino acid oxidase-like deaminating enzyme